MGYLCAGTIADVAPDNKITVVLGLSEREGGGLYFSQWLIGPDGDVIRRPKSDPTIGRQINSLARRSASGPQAD